MRSHRARGLALLLFVACITASCTKADVLYCEDSSDCTDPSRSFCDIGGTFAASDGVGNTCIVDPNNEPPVDAGLDDPDATPDATAMCEFSNQCSDSLPICEGGMCESCVPGSAGDNECEGHDVNTPYCREDGSCRECISDNNCGGAAPICGSAGECTACEGHDECVSGACSDSGACVVASSIVYVSTVGVDGSNCGVSTADACKTLSGSMGAIAKVSAVRTHIVMASGTYTEPGATPFVGISFVGISVDVIGNGAVIVASSSPGPAVTVGSGGKLGLSDLAINGGTGPSIGHGMSCSDSTVRLMNVSIDGSRASGIAASNCTVRLENSQIRNHMDEGLKINGGTITALDTKVENNGKRGADIVGATLHVERSRFFSNELGGVRIENSSFHIESTEVVDNGDLNTGDGRLTGGITIRNSGTFSPQELLHCTVAGNKTPMSLLVNSAGIDCGDAINSVIVNSSVSVRNTHVLQPAQVTENCSVTYSSVTGITQNMGNISTQPSFVNAAGGDYHLMSGSAGIGVADPNSTVMTDIDGQARPASGKDMGSDER